MEFSSIQIVVSVVLILGAAGVALLCDFLKRKNDQLREAMVELQVRRQEEVHVAASPTRTVSSVASRPVLPAPAPVAEETPVEEVQVVPAAMAVEHPVSAADGRSRMNGRNNGRDRDTGENLVRKSSWAARTKAPAPSAQDRTAEWTSVSGRRQSPPATVSEVLPQRGEIKSKEALADWLNRRRAAAQAAQATTSMSSRPEPQVTATSIPVSTPIEMEPDQLAQVVISETIAVPEPVITPEPLVAEQPLPPLVAFSEHSVEIDSALWESLTRGTPAVAPVAIATEIAPAPTVAETQFELIQGAASMSNQLAIPSGMFDQSSLARILEIKKPFNGLAVSIGINENDGSAPRSEDLMRSTSIFISGLLRDGDFGCQSGDDEFLMLCPGPQGAEAQRRLSQIAERLWDFQLRGIGTFSILFSWGGVEVNNETLSDAIASAADRMHQTKRSRKTVSMESVNQRRKAV